MNIRRNDRGTALLLSLAVLAILSMLALSFIRGTSNERLAASNYAISVRAKLNAEAGIQRAIGALQEIAIAKPYSDITADEWVYRNDAGTDLGQYPGTDLLTSKFPSLPYDKDGDGTFENGVGSASEDDLVNGRAVSGVIQDIGADVTGVTGINYGAGNIEGQSAFDPDGMVYKLKIRDTSSKLNINSKQDNLATLLNKLGDAIEEVELFDPIAGRGADIVSFRDGQPNTILRELDELVGLLTQREVDYLKAYLTCYSWRDDTTIKPDPHLDPADLPQLTAEPRYPVNVNTAPEPLLKALITDLKGYEFVFVEQEAVYNGTAAVIDEKRETTAITWAQAGLIAKEIVSARKSEPFRTWDQFKDFVLDLSSKSGLGSMTEGQLDVIRANFNPNTLASRFNPQRCRAHKVAKFDLTRYSTEFCFGPGGFFEIESLGLVTARKGMIVSRAMYSAVVQVADIIRHTTQAQFESNAISSSRTVSYPDSIADLGSGGSLYDGQVEMFTKPNVEKPVSKTTFCIRITSSSTAQQPANHIVTVIPESILAEVAATVTNNRGWKVNHQSNDSFGAGAGFKFTPGTLGGKGVVESVEYCFTVPAGALSKLRVLTKKASAAHIVDIPLTPPDFSPHYDANGFEVQILSLTNKDEDGNTVSGNSPMFHAPFYDKFDAAIGADKAWKGDKGTREKKEDVSVFDGSSLLPDGMLSMRSMAQELGYKATSNLPLEQGSVEFWIKMVGDGNTGANEALFYVVHPLSLKTNGELAEGVINKMIRWENEIINSRAYVGHPDAKPSPYNYSYTESIGDIGDWKDHEWHHIAMSWFDFVDHRLFIDGKLVTNKSTASSTAHQFRLASNEPIDHFAVGGFEFYSPSGANIFNRGTIIKAGQNERFSNCTISDLKVYSTAATFSSGGFAAPERFTANPAAPTKWHGKFVLNRTYPVKLGAISWTEYQPRAYIKQVLNATSAADTDVGVQVLIGKDDLATGNAVDVTVPTAADQGGDGRGYYLNRTLKASTGGTDPRTIEYVLTFSGTVDPLNVTPSIDDVQLTFSLVPAQVVIFKRH